MPNDFEVTFNTGAALLTFVLGALHKTDDLLDEFKGDPCACAMCFRGLIALHIGFQDGIEHVIRRQRSVSFCSAAIRRRAASPGWRWE